MPPFQGGDTGSSPVGATIVGKTSSAMTRSFAFSPCMYRDGKRACAGDLPLVDSADALSEGLADLSCLFDVSEGALTGLFHLFLRLDCKFLQVFFCAFRRLVQHPAHFVIKTYGGLAGASAGRR